MKEIHLSRLFQPLRQLKNQHEFRSRGITVSKLGEEPTSGLIALTHPTKEDSKITRLALPHAFAMVTIDSLTWTGISQLDHFRALVISAMIPVHAEPKEKRQITYELAARLISSGKLVTIAPTGNTTLSSNIPSARELRIGGIIKIIRHSKTHNTFITPAVRYVEQKDITNKGTIADKSKVTMIYGERVAIPSSFHDNEKVCETDILIFSESIVNSWRKAIEARKATT